MLNWLQSIGLVPRSQKAAESVSANPAERAGLAGRGDGVMATCWGRLFDVLHPHSAEVTIFEIAHGLSQINRFNGHTSWPYSVAQHSVLAAQLAEELRPGRHELALACLLHDASEAYLGDVIRPLKTLIGPVYRQLESRVQAAIWQHFEITITPEMQVLIHAIDNSLVRAEAQALMVGSDRWDWGNVQPAAVKIEQLMPCVAKQKFLGEFSRLAAAVELYPATVLIRRSKPSVSA